MKTVDEIRAAIAEHVENEAKACARGMTHREHVEWRIACALRWVLGEPNPVSRNQPETLIADPTVEDLLRQISCLKGACEAYQAGFAYDAADNTVTLNRAAIDRAPPDVAAWLRAQAGGSAEVVVGFDPAKPGEDETALVIMQRVADDMAVDLPMPEGSVAAHGFFTFYDSVSRSAAYLGGAFDLEAEWEAYGEAARAGRLRPLESGEVCGPLNWRSFLMPKEGGVDMVLIDDPHHTGEGFVTFGDITDPARADVLRDRLAAPKPADPRSNALARCLSLPTVPDGWAR